MINSKIKHAGWLIGLTGLIIGLFVHVPDARADGFQYARLALMKSAYAPVPDEVQRFLDQVAAGYAAGHFAENTGLTPHSAYDGEAPKLWLTSRISDDFVCERDFGGMCSSATPASTDSLEYFIRQFGENLQNDINLRQTPPATRAFRDLIGPISFDLSAFQRRFIGDGDHYCTAEVLMPDWQAYQATQEKYGDIIEAELRFIGVIGTWNVRRSPSISSPVLAQVSDEAVLFPNGLDASTIHADFTWHQVNLTDGRLGYIAASLKDLALSSIYGGGCVSRENGRWVISAHIGGGD